MRDSGELDSLIKLFSKKFDDLERSMSEMNQNFGSLERSVNTTNERLGSLERKVKAMESAPAPYGRPREFHAGVGVHSVSGAIPGNKRYSS
jgi:hypothetical protein